METAFDILVPEDASKDRRSRLGKFADWLKESGRDWHTPDLAAYRDYLLTTCKASSVVTNLSTIRGRYRQVLRQDWAISKLSKDQLTALIANCRPEVSSVKPETRQDRIDAEGLRLTREQASALIASPGLDSLIGLRDTALLALMLCTGIREGELVGLAVRDLRQHNKDGELCLHVKRGKGEKTRAVFYGQNDWCLWFVGRWLDAANIKGGIIFRGFYKGGQRLRSGKLTTRSVQKIVARYPVMVDGWKTYTRPHDLRRTYARRCYDEGMDLVAISKNMGIDVDMVLLYVGNTGSPGAQPR